MKAEEFLETGVKAGHSDCNGDSSAEHTLITQTPRDTPQLDTCCNRWSCPSKHADKSQ